MPQILENKLQNYEYEIEIINIFHHISQYGNTMRDIKPFQFNRNGVYFAL